MKKVACLLYPNFSLYEMVTLTSSLALSFGVTIDYVSSNKSVVISEDGLSCQPTKVLDEMSIEDYSCLILPGMIDFTDAINDDKLIQFLKGLKTSDLVIAAISSAPLLLAKAGLLQDRDFTGGIWENFFGYFNFLQREHFKAQAVCQDGNMITAIGFAHQEFAQAVLRALNLTQEVSFYSRKSIDSEEEFLFRMTPTEFEEFKQVYESSIEQSKKNSSRDTNQDLQKGMEHGLNAM
ncbi:DJ-1/PfpI family protein [Streptococcus castoreus]|uniref:DJ-1/PfpI family protein n=1 Tax=Streptococcus castoreus TaxID=254786 RepID=UPI0003FA14BF|nr:DJ-1/PfpI family protein [Streptococcus castoreus]